MTDRNDTLLREVDEELRRERFEKLWKQYSNQILLAAAAVVAMVGGYKLWESRRIAAAEAAGAAIVDARLKLADNKLDDGLKALESLTKTAPAGFGALARLQTAAADLKAGKPADALAAFEALGKDGAADPLLRDYAKIQAAALRLQDADWTEMQNRLNPLAVEKAAWRANARELLGLAAMKAGKTDEARSVFQQLLGDRHTPPGVAERVQMAMARIVAEDLAKAPAAAPAKPADKPAEPPKK